MKQINWGILGCGDVTEVKSGPAFNLIENSRLVAVMRRNAAKAADYAKRHNVPRWYSNADDLIQDEEVNAVYVATPPNAHAELTIKALKAGKPVYVEKPMALNFAECQAMIKASEETGVPLYVAYYRRGLPGFNKTKQLIEAGEIGKVKFVHMELYKAFPETKLAEQMPWRVNPKVAGGGHFYDLASHQLDFIHYLFGDTFEIRGFAKNQASAYAAEDMVSASYLLKDDILVNGNWCFTIPEFLNKDHIEIVGDKGKITLSCFDFSPIKLTTANKVQTFDFPKPKHVQQAFIEEVLRKLNKLGANETNARAAAHTSWVLEQTVKEYYT